MSPPSAPVATLDPLRFPLYGSRLIEASAGTGKTFTIAALYVRLVLGHGETYAHARTLAPPEILVVTFTEAATQELRDRIRARLTEAADTFRADPACVTRRPHGEDLLQDLRASYPPEQWPACARKLQLAAEWMDEAAVSTIHSWCQRMLREHAFDSGSLFTQTLETDQAELLAEAVRDYWRTFMVPLEIDAAAEVLPWWQGPADLQKPLVHLIPHTPLLAPAQAPAESLRTAREERLRRLAKLKAPWPAWVKVLQDILDTAVANRSVNGQKLQARYYQPWLQALRDWVNDPGCERPDLKTGWTRLTPAGLADAWTRGTPPQHPALVAIETLQADLTDLPSARTDILRHAAHWVAARFAAEQARRAQMGFNDLLTRLDAALQGANGERLAAIIRRQFPVALIDEFQDTDPVQYRIFDAVYGVANNDPETALILIGDPKQAIYAFRGADIHTYLAARRACQDRLYTLKKNFRSTTAMVAAANRCFEGAESRETGAGAFLFRDTRGNPLPFIEASAQGRREHLEAGGVRMHALTLWCLPPADEGKPLNKKAYSEQMAEVCASEMVRLLNLGQARQAGFLAEGKITALHPGDMAVLVNRKEEARWIRGALARRGVRSVYLSDQDSVYESNQAAELQHWLAACAEPSDGRLLRAALATTTLGLSWAELDQLNHDELAWDARIQQFRGYRDVWRGQGVLPMLRRLLNDFGLPARLLGQAGQADGMSGERILTNLLHLTELLQQASTLLKGEHALIRHLAEQRQEAAQGAGRGGRDDARQIRLESDADLVQVITVHKSKGLEYPLVFLPFVCHFRQVKPHDLPLKWHDDQDRLQLALASEGDVLEQADRERLGEDLRKLYVALTRARYATWMGIAPLAELEQSAFGYLLDGGRTIPPEALTSLLAAWRGTCEQIDAIPAPPATRERFATPDGVRAQGSPRQSQRVAHEYWWIASYSALKIEGSGRHAVPDTPAEDIFRETPVVVTPALPTPGTMHAFPRGKEAGTFLHDILEWAANQGFAKVANSPAWLRDQIARRCHVRGWTEWIDPLTNWMQSLLVTPLQWPALGPMPAMRCSLAGVNQAVPEMEFWLAAHQVDTLEIDRLVCTHTLDGAKRPKLSSGQLNGMLKGFMDLVFEREGRYYVADYKSNWLGATDAAYTPAAMRAEILHARYELQYVLYLFALHRLLKSRLPDYDYDQHIGGAVYLFLRGINAPGQGLHVERPPRVLIESLDARFFR
ncbi:RecBCD enzyme subunit RecB [Gammaproteobacteria bacterium]